MVCKSVVRQQHFFQEISTYVVVGSTLASGEDSKVDTGLEVGSVLEVLPEEDQTSTGATESLVAVDKQTSVHATLWVEGLNSRRGGDDVTVLKGVVELLSSDETRGVSHVAHQPSTLPRGDLLQTLVVPVSGVGRGTTDEKTGLEDLGLLGKRLVVNQVGVGVESVGQGLEVDGGSGHLLLGSLLNEMSISRAGREARLHERSNRG